MEANVSQDDFASMMQQAGSDEGSRTRKRLHAGQVVQGTVVQIGHDSVFVDVGSTVEGRIDLRELEDERGAVTVRVGDAITASVVSADDVGGPRLSTALGRGNSKGLDLVSLESARDGRLPVEGTVGAAVKGGVEVRVLGARAFCPASQISTEYVSDLASLEGQKFDFLVSEVKNGGRDVVVSRKALLVDQRKQRARATLQSLQVGGDYAGTVTSLQKYGAFVDLGAGVEGLIHVSELARGRVERPEDVLSVGESITVRLLAIQEPEKTGENPRLRLSLRALAAADSPEPQKGEVLEATVSKVATFGVFVETSKGPGLVPTRELGTPRGSDARRQFPVGKSVRVVLVSSDPNRGVTFSISRVAGVEERENFRDFTRAQKERAGDSASLGSFGALLRQELNLPEPVAPEPVASEPEPPASAATPAPAAPDPAAPPGAARTAGQPSAAVQRGAQPLPADRARVDTRTPKAKPAETPRDPSGVIRGRRRPAPKRD